MSPYLELVGGTCDATSFYTPEHVAALFGQFAQEDRTRKLRGRDGVVRERMVLRKGEPDTRWVYRHSSKGGFLYPATRHHPGTKTLLFDRGAIERIVAEFRPPE